MKLRPKSITIIGDCMESISLAQVLKLELINIAKEIYTYSLDILKDKGSKSIFESKIQKTDLVILLTNINTSDIIQLIHILRSYIRWEGAFIAVVNNNKQKKDLESSSLFFQEGFLLYGHKETFGHDVECRPIKLFSLIETIKKSVRLGSSVWNNQWGGEASLMQILNCQASETQIQKQLILEKINKINMKLIPHKFKELYSIVESLRNPDNITYDSINELKYRIRQLLSKDV